MTQSELFKTTSTLRKAGARRRALELLRDALRRGLLDAEGVDKAGRYIQKELAERNSLDVLILGQCTTTWLATALTAIGWGRNLALRVVEGGYDNVLQTLEDERSRAAPPKIVVFLPWHKRLLESQADPEQRLAVELAFWQDVWRLTRQQLQARILQIGYDWIVARPLGQHLSAKAGGTVALVREMNSKLRAHLPDGAYFLDLEQVSGTHGRESFYDMRRYFWTKQPFSEMGACRLADHLCAGIRALHSGPKKILVLDLDNTLWGGVVGETGALGIALGDSAEGEAFLAFQKYLKALAKRGVVLAVASKNNPDDAREPFRTNPDMLLGLDDIAAFEAGWEPKETMLERIAKTLNVGLDSFVFFDDNPAEREHIRQALPDVEVVEVPEDPAEYVRALESGQWFETTGLTAEDDARGRQYADERQRRERQASFGTIDDYLRSLEMIAELGRITDADLPRVVQLVSKTNQFNLTTKRHGHEDIVRMRELPGAIDLTLRLRDRFGEHGLVSVLIGTPENDTTCKTIRIETWLMSCRVISRGVEQLLYGYFLDLCQEHGYERIVGEYIPTRKNSLVAGLFDDLGFQRLSEGPDGTIRYVLAVSQSIKPKSFVSLGGVLT